MANRRMVLVVRKDLALPEGLAMAQASHLCDEWLRKRVLKSHADMQGKVDLQEMFSPDEFEWMESPTVSVLAVNTREELAAIQVEAMGAKLPFIEWHDTIHSPLLDRYIPNVPVGIAIGPVDDDKVKPVTGKLPLY